MQDRLLFGEGTDAYRAAGEGRRETLMDAVRLRARTLLRHHVGASIWLVVLAGLAAGLALGAWAAARRGGGAFDRFVRYADQADLSIYACAAAVPGKTAPCTAEDEAADLRALPEVDRVGRGTTVPVLYELPDGSTIEGGIDVAIDLEYAGTQGTPLVVDGRMPSPEGIYEMILPEGTDAGYPVGTEIWLTPAVSEIGEPFVLQEELRHAVTVVGKVRVPSSLNARVGELRREPETPVLGPAWWREYGDKVATWGTSIQVSAAPGVSADELRTAVVAAVGDRVLGIEPAVDVSAVPAREAISYETAAIRAFAVAVALAALVFVGQALARQGWREAADQGSLQAIGASRAQLVGAAALRAAPVALGAAVLAAVVATASSWWTPVGLAARAEIDPGLSVDVSALAIGSAATFVVVLICLVVPAAVSIRRPRAGRRRLAGFGRHAAEVGLPPTALAGASLLLPAGRRNGLPLRAAMVGAVLAVAVGVGAAVLVGSLDELLAEPRAYGLTWDAEVANIDATNRDEVARAVQAEPLAAAAVARGSTRASTGGIDVKVSSYEPLKGDARPPWAVIVEGREAMRPGEVVVGVSIARRLGVGVGDVIDVRWVDTKIPPAQLSVVGRTVVHGSEHEAGDVLLVVPSMVEDASDDTHEDALLVRLAPGADVDALSAALERYHVEVDAPIRQYGVRNVQRLEHLPWLLAGVVAVLAAAALLHGLAVVSRRHRGQLAVLRALGFTRGQVRRTVLWAATMLGVVAVVLGVPIGVIVGRWAWRWVADSIGVVSGAAAPLAWATVIAVLVLVAVNVLALVPSWSAARERPASALRAE
jgi:putative ABC transport system permease protein